MCILHHLEPARGCECIVHLVYVQDLSRRQLITLLDQHLSSSIASCNFMFGIIHMCCVTHWTLFEFSKRKGLSRNVE